MSTAWMCMSGPQQWCARGACALVHVSCVRDALGGVVVEWGGARAGAGA